MTLTKYYISSDDRAGEMLEAAGTTDLITSKVLEMSLVLHPVLLHYSSCVKARETTQKNPWVTQLQHC